MLIALKIEPHPPPITPAGRAGKLARGSFSLYIFSFSFIDDVKKSLLYINTGEHVLKASLRAFKDIWAFCTTSIDIENSRQKREQIAQICKRLLT